MITSDSTYVANKALILNNVVFLYTLFCRVREVLPLIYVLKILVPGKSKPDRPLSETPTSGEYRKLVCQNGLYAIVL